VTNVDYIDLQVNGYGGIDFNVDDLSAEGFHQACAALARDGVKAILATIITDDVPAMCRRIGRLVELMQADADARSIIAGFHIEGPFISPVDGYRGAHPRDAVRPANPDDAQRLIDAGAGLVKLLTLAPEQDAGGRVTKMLTDRGIAVSAGHTNASLDELKCAIDNGLTLFTHLGNGCPMQVHRHDNIVQRALSLGDRITPMFIADGVHVPFFALGNYLRCAGVERCIVVSDAMAAAGRGPGRYRLGRWEVKVDENLAAWAPDRSHLVGSAMSMARAHHNLRHHLGLDEPHCSRLLSENAKRILRGHA